jgi:hypothetical protein
MHAAAALICLHDQNCIADRPSKLVVHYPNWSLCAYRGAIANGKFAAIKHHIRNFGTQYLTADILSNDIIGINAELLDQLSYIHDVRLGKVLACYVSGLDSSMGTRFLEQCRARVLGDRRYSVQAMKPQVEHTDLCLVVSDATDPDKQIAIFGEVEGNHGQKMLKDSYWDGKSKFAHFGIGMVPKQKEPSAIQNRDKKVLVTLSGGAFSVLGDFHKMIDILEAFILHGPNGIDSYKQMMQPAMLDVISLLSECWQRPIGDALKFLGYAFDEVTGQVQGIERNIVVAGESTLALPDSKVVILQDS